MRLIDADVLENQLEEAISLQGIMALALGTDDEIEAEIKAYKDILNGVKEQPTIPYDMKWNPECEDCRPENIHSANFVVNDNDLKATFTFGEKDYSVL